MAGRIAPRQREEHLGRFAHRRRRSLTDQGLLLHACSEWRKVHVTDTRLAPLVLSPCILHPAYDQAEDPSLLRRVVLLKSACSHPTVGEATALIIDPTSRGRIPLENVESFLIQQSTTVDVDVVFGNGHSSRWVLGAAPGLLVTLVPTKHGS